MTRKTTQISLAFNWVISEITQLKARLIWKSLSKSETFSKKLNGKRITFTRRVPTSSSGRREGALAGLSTIP